MDIKRGSTYNLKMQLFTETNELITADIVSKVEFSFESSDLIIKLYDGTNEEVSYNATEECFIIKFTQQDTFKFSDGEIRYDVRVKFKNNNEDFSVKGANISTINILDSLSEEVL